uniref:Uncharacterized protein n=1 Tax=Avena sativa TaxID=4498 RepID=A0ACD5UBQ6_AVESA
MQRAQTRTTRPPPMHCVVDTTVCWYASSVMAAPTHPIRSPLMFRSMPCVLIFSSIASPPVAASNSAERALLSSSLDAVESLRCDLVGVGELKLQSQRLRLLLVRWRGGGLAHGALGRPGVSFSEQASAICGSPSLTRFNARVLWTERRFD